MRGSPCDDIGAMTDVRKHHRRFTHEVLMRLALDDPERLVRNLRRSGVSYIKALWDACGNDYGTQDRVASAGLTVLEHAHSDTTSIFAIAVPEAVAVTEAVMVGIVVVGGGTGKQASATRYFVLEKSVGGGWGWETALVELAADGSRHNYGEGCEERESALIRRLADLLMREMTPRSPPN